jgi:hypothetical protein
MLFSRGNAEWEAAKEGTSQGEFKYLNKVKEGIYDSYYSSILCKCYYVAPVHLSRFSLLLFLIVLYYFFL